MASKPLPTSEELRQLLRYEADTGKLFWKERPPEMFKAGKQSAAHNASTWNANYAGKEAFTSSRGRGYLQGSIFNANYYAHRVIWTMVYGEPPSGHIDHINGVTSDNRLCNLRAVSNQENMRNASLPSQNSSGAIGVYYHKITGKWAAKIGVDGRHIYLGLFDQFDRAVLARKTAELDLGFHRNHGRFKDYS